MNLKSLEKLLSYSKYGDEDGLKPDLTSNEIETLEWAVGTIQLQEDKIEILESVLLKTYQHATERINKLETEASKS